MGRNSKEHKELCNKKILQYLLKRDTCASRLKAVTGITDSLLKCRSMNADRKREYRAQLENSHKVLCCMATDLEEFKETYRELDSKYKQATRSKAELSDQNVKLHTKLQKMNFFKDTCEMQKKMRCQAEEDCGRYLREKREALEENKALREEIAKGKQ